MDLLEAVIGLGPNLFYGRALRCILVFRQRKAKDAVTRAYPRCLREFKTAVPRTNCFRSTSERIHAVSRLQRR